jgi:hypothetical protein
MAQIITCLWIGADICALGIAGLSILAVGSLFLNGSRPYPMKKKKGDK